MRAAIKQLPGAGRLYDEVSKRINKPEWYFGYKRWESARRIRLLKDKHRGERCFIIGNGPSLNKMDLTLLKDQKTIGMNRIYLLFPKLGFHTTYFACVNPLVVEQFGADIEKLPMTKFIGWHSRKWMRYTDDTILLAPTTRKPIFSESPTHLMWEGATVTYAAMQVAYYLGFQEVILIGVDHNFVDQGKPHQEVVTQSHDANHFDPNYFGKGYRWNLPDLETSEYAYRMAKDHYERNGRRILDATVDGKLQVFPKVEFTSLFG
jgi:hypothetical protein